MKTNTTSYGLTLNKNVKQAYVRLQEGNYDSGKVYSSTGKTTENKSIEVTTSRTNNPLQVMKFNYGWVYH